MGLEAWIPHPRIGRLADQSQRRNPPSPNPEALSASKRPTLSPIRDSKMNTRRTLSRIAIENMSPEVNGGRYPIKRILGDSVTVEADIFADGHDALSAVLIYRKEEGPQWREVPMEPIGNDRWRAAFSVSAPGSYRYSIVAWIDRFETWRRDAAKRFEAGDDLFGEFPIGAGLIETAARQAEQTDAEKLRSWAADLRSESLSPEEKLDLLALPEVGELVRAHADRTSAVRYPQELGIVVDPTKARFSTWYEMFPRSCAAEAGRYGTLADCQKRLPYIAAMGFDVLYLPPIHPIGRTHRKGRNNAPRAAAQDPGSPWAIGSEAGGHKAVHPELGTLEDFRTLVARAREQGIEIALDLAFQCSPDHPYVTEHPEWFRRRPDGSIRHAENPPKKYEDIYPFDFESPAREALWEELKSIVEFWIEQGVRIFRVDNPHTKPFDFWEWLITGIKRAHPEIIFLAEAFTRPRIMYHLAKRGFSQSYTYFAWRNTKRELIEYFTELNSPALREYFRPHLWPNTPDILTEYLQTGGRPAFMIRLILAATLGASYGIYGPAFELCENVPREIGSEEYLNSEKYEIRHWEIESPHSLRDFIAHVNAIRRENPALQQDANLRFHPVDNERMICYTKHTDDLSNILLMVVNLDPHHTQSGWIEIPVKDFHLGETQTYQVHDLLSDARYVWEGRRNYIEINPRMAPAQILRIHRKIRTERDFDYYA